MKKKLIFVCLIIFTAYILCFPNDAMPAAANGLVLWYEKVLPSLLPFAILSHIFIHSGYLEYVTRIAAPILRQIIPVSNSGAFVILSGFLFGFPMGSRNCAELLKTGQLQKEEADVLFAISNNISPVFISSYILYQQLGMPSLTLLSYGVLFLPPLAVGTCLLFRVCCKTSCRANCHERCGNYRKSSHFAPGFDFSEKSEKKAASESKINFKIIDAGIMNGFETLARLGGYIMLFSMIASMVQKLPLGPHAKLIITGATELTNGISLLKETDLSPSMRYIVAMGFTAFGGISGIAQTSSMIKGTGLSLKNYILLKCILTALSILFACGACAMVGLF